MALEGTLRDFSLADIFQLIGLQRKTGILTLRHLKEEARILFMNGLVVGSDTNNQKLENRLGWVLVKSNRISQNELEQALAIQSKTLQRLGQVLIQKGFIKREDLRESLRIQVTEIIFRLFRWVDGEYHFTPQASVEYDQENFTPISSESILMQGVRMLDEWPMIERIIVNFEILVEKTPRARGLRLQMDKKLFLEPNMGESFDTLLQDVITSPSDSELSEEILDLSHEQEVLLKMIEGPTVVQDLIDRAGLNEFETCRTLYDLFEAGLVRKVAQYDYTPDVKVAEETRQIPVAVPAVLLLIMAVFSFTVAWNPLNVYVPTPLEIPGSVSEFNHTVHYRLKKVGNAIDRHFFVNGELPVTLRALVSEHLLDPKDMVDPVGREFRYELNREEKSYRIQGMDRSGHTVPELRVAKSYDSGFSAESLQE